MLNDSAGATPSPQGQAGGGGFRRLLGGFMSGMGEGMMTGPFKAAYQGGQQGVRSPYQARQLWRGHRQMDEDASDRARSGEQTSIQEQINELDRARKRHRTDIDLSMSGKRWGT